MSGGGAVSQLCATEEGVFLRRFISSQVGCGWYKLTDDGNVQEWEDKVECIVGDIDSSY